MTIFQLVSKFDKIISDTIEEVRTNEKVKALYARWKSVRWLADEAYSLPTQHVKIKLLDITMQESINDLAFAGELETSQLHRLIYQQELDYPGGEPFGILIGDFKPNKTLLKYMNPLATAALAPYISSTDAKHLDLDEIKHCNTHNEFKNELNISQSRFIVLGFPAIRLEAPDIWTNPAYFIGISIMHAFAKTGWFSKITNQALSLPEASKSNHAHIDSLKPLTQAYLTDEQLNTLAEIGVIGLKTLRLTQQLVFQYAITQQVNESLSHILCACRFAHYLKVIMREKVGSFKTAEQCENYLKKWLIEYCANSSDLTPNLAARYPLHKAKVSVSALPAQPGEYACQLYLVPHWQLSRIETKLRLLMRL